ncbi:MAG: acyl-CoA dehydrogenase family protein [Actinomycetota bacterium]
MSALETVCRTADDRAVDTERLGHLHPDIVTALLDAGALRAWIAAEHGGQQRSLVDGLRLIEQVSEADGSAGWCTMIANCTALISFRLPAEWADKVFADPAACTGGFGMPAGTARVVDGGLEVTGRWAWGSGTDHCTWIGGGVRVVDDDGEPAAASDGARTPFVLFDLDDVELLDTWHVSGLKGTASTDYRVERAFVPEGRWVQLVGTEPRIDAPLGRYPFFCALAAGVAAVTIGLAERAVTELVAIGEKRSAGSSKTLAERAPVQADLAMARAGIGQARSYLHETAERLWDAVSAAGPVDDDARVELRMAATAAARRCVEAVDLCFHAAGGTAVYETSPLQRVFRDAHVAASHGMIAARTMEPLGRYSFGLPTSTVQF